MKRILFIVPKLSTGGNNTSLDSLYTQMRDRFEISVFSLSHQPISHDYSFIEVLLPQDRLLSLVYANYSDQRGWNKAVAFFVKLIRYLLRIMGVDFGLLRGKRVANHLEREEHYDYIVGYQEGNATTLASLFSNPNKIAWIHCDYNKYLPQNKSEKELYANFKKIISVSKYTTSVFANRYPSLSDRTQTIQNLIDTSRILKLAETPIDDSRFLINGVTLLSAGRFHTVKRFSKIPEVASSLKQKGLRFMWYVLGPEYSDEELSAYHANLIKYDVNDCVKWLGGKSNPYSYFAAANIYVCLSESEACPMVFKEAKLLGLPIITTDFPSSYEFVHDNDGIITSIDNLPESIADMIQRIERGFRLQSGSDDNQEIIDKICALFD